MEAVGEGYDYSTTLTVLIHRSKAMGHARWLNQLPEIAD